MKRIILLLVVLAVCSTMVFGQTAIPYFSVPRADTVVWKALEGGNKITVSMDSVDKVSGQATLKVRSNLAALHQWGTFTQFGYTLAAAATPWDITISDSISIWIKVRMAPKVPQNMVLRIQFADQVAAGGDKEQWIYENASILRNATPGWINLRVPLKERATTGTEAPDSTGFITPPSNWGGLTWNDKKFNRERVIEWNIGIVTTGWDPANNLPADSIEVSFGKFERFGARAVPMIVFNGIAFPTNVVGGSWSWGQSTVSVEKGAGTSTKANAIKWVQGDEWKNGWTGWGVDVAPPFNLAGGWVKDSLKFKMKADTGTGAMRAQFESANGKKGVVFTPIADGKWRDYSFALRTMTVQDNAPAFDSSAITKFGIMAEATAKAGKVIFITDLWTGSPVFDLLPPDAPAGVAVAGSNYTNLVTWNPVTKAGCTYNVFFSDKKWLNADSSIVEDLPPYNLSSTLATHLLLAPDKDQNVSYYYGVMAQDASGNKSPVAVMSTAVTSLAKGVPTIALSAPPSFTANGSLTEWAGIKPFILNTQKGTAHAAPNFPIADSLDLSVKAYVAMDATNLYVAFDVVDNVVAVDTTKNDYEQDCPDIFIGLYDWKGKRHDGYARGATPDYHLRFSKNRIRIDNDGGPVLTYATTGNPNYIWKEKTLTPGYIVEVKIPFATLAAALAGKNDVTFVPKPGMRIPIDFAINDRDDPSATGPRKGIMVYSPLSNDDSWKAMFYWSNTWTSSTASAVEKTDGIALQYELSKNYPNPFNPSTQIKYGLAKSGMVTLKVYDVVGRLVTTLVDGYQEVGKYTVTFNTAEKAFGLSSGVYFYRLESGSFISVDKMMLLK